MQINWYKTFVYLIFPGYFFYHALRSWFDLPYIGWFSVVLILAVPVFGLKSLFSILSGNAKVNGSALLISSVFWLMIVLICAMIGLHHLLDPQPYMETDGLLWSVSIVVWTIGFYLIGQNTNIKQTTHGGLTFFVTTALFCALTYHFYQSNSGTVEFTLINNDSGELANYQGIARSVLFMAILYLPFIESKFSKTIYFLTYLIILYFIGSRSDLILMLAVVPFYVFFNFGLLSALATTLASIAAIPFAIILELGLADRYSFMSAQDASLSERSRLLEKGLQGIINDPIVGDYLGQVRDFEGVGYYIHNALSMWQAFGLFPFLMYVTLLILSLFTSLTLFLNGKKTGLNESLFYISFICIVAVIASKSITWAIPALAWGMAFKAIGTSNKRTDFGSHRNLEQHS